jgi:transposase
MGKEETAMKDTIVGLDLAKNVFHLATINQVGKLIKRKKLKRSQVREYFIQLEPCRIAMEACASAHYWAREFKGMGHEVELLPAQHVKAYSRGQKNDYNDALAIAESALHGTIRPVTIKCVEQQDDQALHRIRCQLVGDKTRLINQVRGLLAEYGIVLPQSEAAFRREIPVILGDAENGLTMNFRQLLNRQHQRFLSLVEEITWYQGQLNIQARTDDVCRRLTGIPGFGPVVSSGVKGWMGDGRQFNKGRDASAALGLVPRQHSTGGKERLSGITKRGDPYVRSLVIHGARTVVMRAKTKTDPLSVWINRLVATRGFNKAVVALANKLVRIAWVIIARNETYKADVV